MVIITPKILVGHFFKRILVLRLENRSKSTILRALGGESTSYPLIQISTTNQLICVSKSFLIFLV